jgi:LacI family transcriptional regulator, repressor for deo operon, udp, cdd, tsx, nupC, and nupG
VRMRDVAKRAGVGLTTVSRAFSEPQKLSPETLRRIEVAVRDLNYTVDMSARSLRANMTGRILVMLPDIGNSFFSLVIKGIEEIAFSSRRIILIGDTRRGKAATQSQSTQSYTSQFDAGRVDGIILLDGSFPLATGLEAQGLEAYPIVAVSERANTPGLPYVGIDNRAAARDVVTFLAQMGHRDIVHIAGSPGNISAGERVNGFCEGLATVGVAVEPTRLEYGDYSIVSGRAAARRLLNRYPLPTAIFSSNDEMAMGAIHELKMAGLRVPQDVSVIGFDNLEFSEVFDPPITSIRQPQREMGRAGMQLVIGMLEGSREQPDDAILRHEIVARASSGPACR